MQSVRTRQLPKPGQLWLSCPPYVLIAQVLAVEEDRAGEPPVVTYELHDEDGSVLHRVDHAALDEGWWRAFQPLVRREG
jgi:hypothetical protein